MVIGFVSARERERGTLRSSSPKWSEGAIGSVAPKRAARASLIHLVYWWNWAECIYYFSAALWWLHQLLRDYSVCCHCSVKESNDAISGNGAFRDGTNACVRLNGNWEKHNQHVFAFASLSSSHMIMFKWFCFLMKVTRRFCAHLWCK